MGQTCTICNSSKRLEIDRELCRGKSYQMIANAYNVSWQAVRRHYQNGQPGAPTKYESPEALWQACCRYFRWVEDNPLYEAKHVQYKGETWIDYVPRPRPMMKKALCRFIGLTQERWRQMGNGEIEDPGFIQVVRTVDSIIEEQKYSGAVVGFFRADLISRDSGLRNQHEISGFEGNLIQCMNQIDVSNLTDEELKLITKVKPDLLN